MAELIVVSFKKDMYRASQVLNQLPAMDDDWLVDLRDAVAAYRDYKDKLRVDQSYQITTGENAGWGSLLGSVIVLTLAIPFTEGATASAAGAFAIEALVRGALGAGAGTLDASGWQNEFGIPDEFVKQIGAMVHPGDSAIFALLRTADPAFVANEFCSYGGTILSTTLSRESAGEGREHFSEESGGLTFNICPLLRTKENTSRSQLAYADEIVVEAGDEG